MSKGYVWYSFGSDETGAALANALGFESGKKTPSIDKHPLVVCWGAKAGTTYNKEKFLQSVAAGKLRLINTVEAIEANRHKLATLKLLKDRGVSVPGMAEPIGNTDADRIKSIIKAVQQGVLSFPIVACGEDLRTPLFCQTEEDITYAFKKAGTAKIEFFRTHCPGTEFRVHVLRDQVLVVQRKDLAKDPIKAYTDELIRILRKRREKEVKLQAILSDQVLSPAVMSVIVNELAEDLLDSPSHMQRSVSKGWEFKDVPVGSLSLAAKEQAIRALDAAGLDLGAVSVSVDGKDVRVTNITTGPHLPPEHMAIYAKAIGEFASQKSVNKTPKAVPASEKPAAAPEIRARLVKKLEGMSTAKAERLLALLEED